MSLGGTPVGSDGYGPGDGRGQESEVAGASPHGLQTKSPLRNKLAPLALVLLIVLVYLPTFIWLVRSWLADPNYSHGFLVPLVSAILVWRKRSELTPGGRTNLGAAVLALGIALYLIGFVWGMRYVSALSFIVVLSGLMLHFYGMRATWSMAFPIGFLVFMIPMPFIGEMAFDLQNICVHSSGWLLRVLGLSITISGAEIVLDDMTFSVGLPCSGMNTLIALLAFAALYAYLLVGTSFMRVVLLLCSIPIAILANILRIASIILVAYYYNEDFALGFYHDLSNLLVFLLAFICLFLLGRILGCRLIAPRQEH
jgi:exosortase